MNRRPGRIPIVAMTLLATLAIGVGAGAVAYSALSSDTKTVIQQVPVAGSEPAGSSSTLTAAQIYRNTHESVVEITVGSTQVDPFGGEQQQRGQGSGFVIDSDGHIVTNDHVVEDAETVSVRFSNGKTYDASVVGADPSTDLAVIKVDAPDSVLHPLPVGDSSDVQVGNTVFALGSPLGLEDSFTSGIVSALHRQIDSLNAGFRINDAIQTDAAINHGNSGGPLLNSSGQVVGVNAQIAGNTGANVGIGFAIPSNTVKKIAAQLIDTGDVQHAYLGVQVQDVPAEVAEELGLVEGVQIAEIPQGSSQNAGRQGGASRLDRREDDRRQYLFDRRRRGHRDRRAEDHDLRGAAARDRREEARRHDLDHLLAERRQPHGRREARQPPRGRSPMRSFTPKRILVAASALSLAVGAGGAIAASNSSSKSGESFLSRVAGHLGISTEKLEDATKAAAIDEVDEQLQAGKITKAQADELKARIRKGGAPFLFGERHRFGGPGRFHGRLHHAPFGHLSAATDYLGLSFPQLLEQLKSGKSLADVAKAQGKSVDGLKKAMLADAKKRLAEAVDQDMLTEAQAKEMLGAIESKLDDIVNGKFPARGERHFRGPGGPPGNGAWRLPPAA